MSRADEMNEAMGLYRALGIIDKWQDPDHIRLHAGEMTTQEMRSVLAILRAVRADIAGPYIRAAGQGGRES